MTRTHPHPSFCSFVDLARRLQLNPSHPYSRVTSSAIADALLAKQITMGVNLDVGNIDRIGAEL
jgi:hypothetical protein